MQKAAVIASIGLAMSGIIVLSAGAQQILPRVEPPFQGKIGRTAKESAVDFPKSIEAPKGAPNILVILTDDVGFGAEILWWKTAEASAGMACTCTKESRCSTTTLVRVDQ